MDYYRVIPFNNIAPVLIKHYLKVTYANKGSGACSIHSISAELLENVVFQELKTYARLAQEQESVLIERLVETIYGSQNKEISLNKTKVSEYKNKLKSVNTSIKNLFEEKCSGSIPQDIFKQLMTKYSEERKLLEAKIEHFVGIIKSCNERNGDSEK